MRKDMAKVIVERPRRNRDAESYVKGRKLDFDDLPSYEGMQAGRRRGWSRKEPDQNLQPLRRYLRQQVGRPWDDVYSEICQTLNPMVRQKLSYVFSDVAINTFVGEDGRIHTAEDSWRSHGEVDGLYVHPESGLLCDKPRKSHRYHHEPFAPKADYIPFGYERAYQRLDGIWYEVFYTIQPDTVTKRYYDYDPATPKRRRVRYVTIEPQRGHDVVAGKWPTPSLFPQKNRYAHAKRQLTSAELKAAGLVNLPPKSD